MEAKDYIKIIKKNLIFIILLTGLGAFLGFYSGKFLPSGYKQSQVFFVSQVTQSQDQSSLLTHEQAVSFTDSAQSILQSPDFLLSSQIFQSSVEVKKLANRVLKITVSSQTEERSKKDLGVVVANFNNKVSNFLGNGHLQLTPVGDLPHASYFALDTKILSVVGALLGLISAIAILALANYFKL